MDKDKSRVIQGSTLFPSRAPHVACPKCDCFQYQLWFKILHRILRRIFQYQGKKRKDSLSYHEYF